MSFYDAVANEWSQFFTAGKRNCGKVMFLQVSVILFTGEGSGPGGVPGPGGSSPGGIFWFRGVSGPRECLVPGEGLWSRGRGCLVEAPGRLLLRAVCILLEFILVFRLYSEQILFANLHSDWISRKYFVLLGKYCLTTAQLNRMRKLFKITSNV